MARTARHVPSSLRMSKNGHVKLFILQEVQWLSKRMMGLR